MSNDGVFTALLTVDKEAAVLWPGDIGVGFEDDEQWYNHSLDTYLLDIGKDLTEIENYEFVDPYIDEIPGDKNLWMQVKVKKIEKPVDNHESQDFFNDFPELVCPGCGKVKRYTDHPLEYMEFNLCTGCDFSNALTKIDKEQEIEDNIKSSIKEKVLEIIDEEKSYQNTRIDKEQKKERWRIMKEAGAVEKILESVRARIVKNL